VGVGAAQAARQLWGVLAGLKVGGGYFGVTGSGYSSCYLWLFWLGDFGLQLGGVRSAVGDSEKGPIG
jgi:hypothetical protein